MRIRLAILVSATAIACGGPTMQQAGTPVADTQVNAAGATITPSDMIARISFLASDALRGRDTPSPGLEAAAAYIAGEFQRLGLAPRPDSGTYFQRYPLTVRRLHADSTRLTISTRGEQSTLTYGSEILTWAGTAARARGEPVFVGTRLVDASDFGQRIPVVFIRGAMDRAWRTAVNNARIAALAAGAPALIVVLDPAITADQMRQRADAFSTTIAATPVAATVFIRYDLARDWFRRAGADLDALVTGPAQSPTGVPLRNTEVELALPVAEVTHYPPNVVGVLPGSDSILRNSYVVLSAHMDHIGVGAPNAYGDSINNGADDDASGTSAILEIAEAFAALPARPARSIVFLAVSGEEKGLLGSRYFAERPVVPLASMVANINLDMIGRNAPDSIVALGQDYTSLGPLTQEVARNHPELGLTVARDIWPQERFFFRSDHFNFARKEIPAIFFFAGVHDDYHKPSDEVGRIDGDKAARVARLAYYLAHEIASRREPPVWTKAGIEEVRAMSR